MPQKRSSMRSSLSDQIASLRTLRRDTSNNFITPLLSSSKRSSVTIEAESKDYLVIYSPPRLSETVGASTSPSEEGVIKSKYENQPRRKSTIQSVASVSSSSAVIAEMKEVVNVNRDIKRINNINRRKSVNDGLDQSVVRQMVVNRRNSLVTSPTSKTKQTNDSRFDTSSLLKKYDFINDDIDNFPQYEFRDFNDDSVLSQNNVDESVDSVQSVTCYPSFGGNLSNNVRKGSVRKSFVNLSNDNDSDHENSELSELSPVHPTSKRPVVHTAIKNKFVDSGTSISPLMMSTEDKEEVDHPSSVHMQLKAAAALLLDAIEEQGRLKALLSYTDKADIPTSSSTDLQLRLTGALIELEAAVHQNVKWRSQCDAANTRADDAERALSVLKNRLSEVELERDNYRNEVKEMKRQQLLGSPLKPKPEAAPRRVLGGVSLPFYSNVHDYGMIPPPIESPPPEAADPHQSVDNAHEMATDHVILTVEVDGSRSEQLVIFPDSDPITLAFEFLKDHALPPEYLEPLIKYISITQATKFAADKQNLNDSTDARPQNDSSNESSQSIMYLSPSSTETERKNNENVESSGQVSPLSATPNSSSGSLSPGTMPSFSINNSLGGGESPVPPPPVDSPLNNKNDFRNPSQYINYSVSSASTSDDEYDAGAPPKKPTSPLQEAQRQYERDDPYLGLSPAKYTYMNLSEKFKDDPSGVANDSDLQMLAAVEKEAIVAFKEQEKILDIIHQGKYEAAIPSDIIPTSPFKAPMSRFSTAVEYFDRASSLANSGDLENAVPLYHYALKMFETAGIKNLKLIREEVDYWTDMLKQTMPNTQEYTPEPSFATKHLEKTTSSTRATNTANVNTSKIKTPSGKSKIINKQTMLLSPDE